jgi:hypothetical protein
MFSHLNPDVLVTRNSYELGYNRNPEVSSEVIERRTNPFSVTCGGIIILVNAIGSPQIANHILEFFNEDRFMG